MFFFHRLNHSPLCLSSDNVSRFYRQIEISSWRIDAWKYTKDNNIKCEKYYLTFRLLLLIWLGAFWYDECLYCSMTVEGVQLFKLFLYVKNGHTLIEGGYYRHVRYLIGRPGLRPHPTILLEKNQRAIKFQWIFVDGVEWKSCIFSMIYDFHSTS